MATKREQFQELRRGGMDAVKAQEQVYGIMPTAPTISASVTPAIANIGGAPESLGDKNRRQQAEFAQNNIPVAPAVQAPTITPQSTVTKQDYSFMGADKSPLEPNIAPVVPPSSVGEVQAPVVAQTTTVAPPGETLGDKNRRQQAEFAEKTKNAVDFNTSIGREQEILKNLNDSFASVPALFQNQDSFKKAYGYETADEGKKAILDSFFASKKAPLDSNSLFSQLSQGVAISDPRITGTADYKMAKARFDTLNKYKSYTADQIGTALNTGDLLPGTREYNDAILDPATKAKIDSAKLVNTINGKVPDTTKVGEALTKKVIVGTLAKALEDGDLSADELQSLSQTDEIREKAKEVNDLAMKRNEMKANFDRIENDVTEKLKGTNATSSDKAQMIANARKLILPEYNLAIDNYNTAYGAYTEAKKDALNLFAQNMDLYKERKASEAANARDERNFTQQKELVSLQQAYQNPDINSTNPQIAQIATQRLIDESLKFAQTNGVPVTRNSGAILADAKAYVQRNGVSLAQAIQTTFTDPLTQKPEYQNALDNIRSKNEPTGKLQVIGQRVDPATGSVVNVYGTVDKSGNIVEATNTTNAVNQSTNDYAPGANSLKSLASKYPGVAAFKNDNPAGITWNANFENGTGTAKALQDAGINFSKGTARPAKEGGNYVAFDSIEDGLAAQRIIMEKTYGNSTVANLLSSWVGTGEGSAYANQVANMAGIDKNTTVNRLSQQQLDALQIAKLKKESPGLYNELQNKGVVDGNTINFSKVAPVDYNTAISSEGTAGDFARSIKAGNFTISGVQGTQGQQEVTQVEKDTFKFAESLTPNEASTFLKKKGLLDKYITYKATQDTPNSLEGISSIEDIIFPEKTTEFKTKSYNYGTRMDQAERAINNMAEKYKSSWMSSEYFAPRGDYVPNFLKSSDRQVYEQAQRNFINAVLRQESGAAIGKDEFDNARIQYFPAAGDSEEVLNTKKTNRETVIFNMFKSAGKDEKGRDIGNIWKNLRLKQPKDINTALQNLRNSK